MKTIKPCSIICALALTVTAILMGCNSEAYETYSSTGSASSESSGISVESETSDESIVESESFVNDSLSIDPDKSQEPLDVSTSDFEPIYLPSAEYLLANGVKEEEGVSGIYDPGHPIFKVTIENRGDLAETGIQLVSMDYIEPYLHDYLNYYQPDGKYYYAKYVEDSYIESYNIPRFNVYIEELDLEIECLFIIDEHYYRFKSRFNPNGE